MTILPSIDMAEATRLTREGRLGEALAVLRGGGASPSDATPPQKASRLPSVVRGVLDRLPRVALPGALAGLSPTEPPVRVPDGARFEQRQYAGPGGGRSYKLFVPSAYAGQALPLVVMLHGCTQSSDDFAAGTRMNEVAEAEGFFVAYPAQDAAANSSRCWNWFRPGDQRRDAGEPALIAGITRQIMREVAVSPGRVYVAGLSAGGAAAAVLGQAYPELFAAVGVHSGLACGAARDMPSAFAAMKQGGAGMRDTATAVPTIVFHGDRDATVNPVNGDQVLAQATTVDCLATVTEQGAAPGGVAFTRTVHVAEDGRPMAEQWVLHGAGHAWSGGSAAGSFTDPRGPDASRAMMRFFRHHAVSAPAMASRARPLR